MFSLMQNTPETTKRLALEFMVQFIENKALYFEDAAFAKVFFVLFLFL